MVVLFCCCLALAAAVAASPLLSVIDRHGAVDSERRIAQVDGLRGILALGVLVHHAALYPAWLETGRWTVAGRVDTMLGEGGVAMFFMITGYLFWSRLLARRGSTDWTRLYIGRVFRIGPLYLAASVSAVAATFALTRQLNVPWPKLAHQLTDALALGAVMIPDVNGYRTPLLLAGVTWSLQYEWAFYICLPLLAVLARTRFQLVYTVAIVLALAAAALGWLPHPAFADGKPICCILEFAVGMLAGSLQQAGCRRVGAHPAGSPVAVLCLAAAVGGFGTAQAVVPILLLGTAFCLITSGADLFGLLIQTPMRRLGEISYGIYLLQGLVLAMLFRPAPLRAVVLGSTAGWAAMTLLATIATVLVATMAFVWIERPGQRLGQKIDGWRRARAPRLNGKSAVISP